MFRFISFVLLITFMIVLGSSNLRAAEANDAEMHYFRGVEYYMRKQYHLATLEFGKALKLNPHYAEAQSAFKVAYAKLKGNGSEENITSENNETLSPDYGCLLGGYGCLGAYQGAIFGGVIGVHVGVRVCEAQNNCGWEIISFAGKGLIVGALTGAVMGGFLGSRADTPEAKGCIIVGSAGATAILVGVILSL